VGWSEIPRYSFRVPAGWDENPVSIADLGGTEVRELSGSKAQSHTIINACNTQL
jgi:hypothetical protein